MKKVEIIKENCIKCGMCYSMDDTVFGPDSESFATVISEAITDQTESIANNCPGGAIIITEKEEN